MPNTPTPRPSRPGYTTNAMAAIFGVVPHTARVSYCEKGSYLGIVPVKLPNGRLLWPGEDVEAVARGESIPTGAAA